MSHWLLRVANVDVILTAFLVDVAKRGPRTVNDSGRMSTTSALQLQMDLHRRRWLALLSWLSHHGMNTNDLLVEPRPTEGGHGLFALKTCPPSSPLFFMPASAMMNIKTLSPHYPSGLTAFQLMTLHLLLHRPEQDRESLDPLFGPYISILPRTLDFHPLVQLVKTSNKSNGMLDLLTPSSAQALGSLAVRFSADFKAVCKYLRKNSKVIQSSTRFQEDDLQEDNSQLRLEYLWSWLIVNTRCIYLQLKESRSHPDNLTLCPVLDFANHAQYPHIELSVSDKKKHPNEKRAHFAVSSPENKTVSADEELFLTYGAHCNRVLFVEYGFVLQPTSERWENCIIEVQVDDIVEELFSQKDSVGEWMVEILKTENYWRDWTIHCDSESAFPSYRLVTCLRLHSLLPRGSVPDNCEDLIRPWRRTIVGTQDEISAENETAWKETLKSICCSIIARAEIWMKHRKEAGPEIMILWKEELFAAQRILDRIHNGEELF